MKQKEVYDVVIIGAGPAGLNCAEKLAKSKKKVLVVEQKKVVGSKVCGGGLLGHDIKYLKLPDSLLDYKFNKEIVHSPHNIDTIKLDYYFIYTINRKNLGQWMLKKTLSAGAKVITNSRVTKIEKNHIIVNNLDKIKFKYLVGAGGVNSIVRRYLKLPNNPQIIGMHYLVTNRKFKNIEFFFDSKYFHSWYAWIFPHKGYTSIGCGCDPKVLSPNKLLKNFKEWLNKNKINVKKAKFESHLIGCDYERYKFKNIFLIGDAAGLTSVWTGEGIYPALISGEEVAKLIIDKKYEPKKLNKIIKHKKLHDMVIKILENSGPFREVEYEIMLLLLKNRHIDKKFLKYIA